MTFLAHWEVPERTIFTSDSASHFNHHKHEQTKILKLEKVIYYARPCMFRNEPFWAIGSQTSRAFKFSRNDDGP